MSSSCDTASGEQSDRRARRLSAAQARRRRQRRWIGAAVVVLVLGAAAGWLIVQNTGQERIADSVTVAGVQLGGQTEAAARQTLESWLTRSGVTTVTLRTSQGSQKIALDRLGIRFDVPATVQRALTVGRHEAAGLVLWTGSGGAVEPVLRVRPRIYERGLAVVRDRVDRPAVDASLRLSGKKITVVQDQPGVTVDDIRLERSLLAALSHGRAYAGAVPTLPVVPAITTTDALERRAAAVEYLRRPLILRLGDHRIRLRPAVMATMLSVTTGSDAEEYPLTFDNPAARAILRRLFRSFTTKAVDASVEVKGHQAYVTESREGRTVDMDRLTHDMTSVAAGSGLREVHVSLTTDYPELTTDALRSMGLSALGSEFTTYYSPRNKARAANIALAARLVDGTIVRPGKTFSLNDTLGPRTENRGFDSAPVIVDGVLRQGVGGGICQYATTLFNAVFFAGLPIVERHPHSFAILHYPLGRDAAVSWGSADLRFRNDTKHPLMIRSFAAKGSLTVVIVGTTGRTVTYTTGPMRHVHRPAATRSHPRVIYDVDLSHGITMLEEGGTGYQITVVRTVTAGGRVVFRDRFVSRYAPRDWVRRIGTRT